MVNINWSTRSPDFSLDSTSLPPRQVILESNNMLDIIKIIGGTSTAITLSDLPDELKNRARTILNRIDEEDQ